MSKRKADAKMISGFVDSDDEDVMELQAPTVASNEQTAEERPAKKHRGRPRSAQQKTGERSQSSSRSRPMSAGSSKDEGSTKTSRGRQRVYTESESRPMLAIEEEDEVLDQQDLNGPTAGNVEPRSSTTGLPKKRGRPRKATAKPVIADDEFEYTPTRQVESRESDEAPVRNGIDKQHELAENDAPAQDDENDDEPDEGTGSSADESTLIKRRSSTLHKTKVNGQQIQRSVTDTTRKRKDILESEKTTAEPELRRKLGEMTKKYEALESKFRNLREIGIVEANANFEKLRKQCEATTAASNELVSSLKKELAAQTALAQKSRSLQKQLQERDDEVNSLQSQVDDLASQLSAAQTEIKALQSKLAAARNATASSESVQYKVPGSTTKSAANRNAAASNAEAVQIAQLKEDLYSDLTGLIIRNVKKRESDDLYDCIQTGTNGTLHFKLAISHDGDGKSGGTYDNAEFHYMPLLDPNRDRDLVELLPEYLTVEITFSRQNASKFYTRVMDTLTKRRIEPDE